MPPAAEPAGAAPPLLHMQGISKSFPGVRALEGVDLRLGRGEVLALVGENGAGKSTLMKVLGGAYPPDAGRIVIDGRPHTFHHPADAQRAGIAVIYQEFNLVPSLTARENIFLGRERTRLGFIGRASETAAAQRLFQRIGIDVPADLPVDQLSVAQQQAVEIAKALSLSAGILVMDEPSAVLSDRDIGKLFDIMRELKAQGIGVVYISHRLEEVFHIADRVMILRDGRHVATGPVGEFSREQLIERMVGRPLEQEFPPRDTQPGPVRLRVCHLRRGRRVRDVSFTVRRGEVLALTGLVGAGRTETARLIFGADRPDAGAVELDGRRLAIRSPRHAIERGICLLTEDRKAHGLILRHSVRDNFALPNLPLLARLGWVDRRRETAALQQYIDALRIKLSDPDLPAANLSGGNQQKVVLAKWLHRNCEVVIFDEPTRGIDVGAKFEIYQLINQLAGQGKAVIMISSELPEVLGMADRILVMHAGRISGEIADPAHATQEQILALAIA